MSLILGTSLWHPTEQASPGLAVMGIDPIYDVDRLSARKDHVLTNEWVETDIYKVGLSNGQTLEGSLGSQYEVRVTNGPWQVLTLEEILTWFPPLTDPRPCVCKQEPLLEHRYELRQVLYYIPFTQFEVRLPPYWVGVIATSGGFQCGKVSVCIPPELASRMRDQNTWDFYLYDLPIHKGGVVPNENEVTNYKYLVTNRRNINTDIERELKNLELWEKPIDERFIHPSYKFCGFDERVNLIQGIMDSSGYVDPIDGIAKARLRSTKLADDLVFLVRTIGGYARKVSQPCRGAGVTTVEVYMPDPEYPFSRPSIARLWHRSQVIPPPIYIDYVRKPQEHSTSTYLRSISLSVSEAYIGEDFLPVRPILT